MSFKQSMMKPLDNVEIGSNWIKLLTALGLGLTIITYTMPLGIHSIAIMAFCIAAAYLGFYFFTRQSEKK